MMSSLICLLQWSVMERSSFIAKASTPSKLTDTGPYISGPYRSKMFNDETYFIENPKFYRERVLYHTISDYAGNYIGDNLVATVANSAVCTVVSIFSLITDYRRGSRFSV